MNNIHSRALSMFCLIVVSGVSAHAAFQTPMTSVRSASMGSASMATVDEAAALFTNPAGLALMTNPEIGFMYNKLYAGLPGVANMGAGYMALAVPTSLGTVGLGVGSFMASGLKSERTVAASYGRAVGKLRLGVTAKYLSHSYDTSGDARAERDPVFANGTSKSAMSADIGMVASIMGPLRAGFAVRNINQPDVGLATEDRVPREFHGGLFLDVSGLDLRTSADMFIRDNGFGDTGDHVLPALGLEKGITGQNVVMRLGANPLEFTGGVGLRVGRFGFDYGIVLARSMMSDNFGSHRVGMSYQFSGLGFSGERASSGSSRGARSEGSKSKKDKKKLPSRRLSKEDDLWRDGFFGVR